MKTLIAKEKTKDKAFNQLKRWFNGNPNRKEITIKLQNETIVVKRGEIIK
jgi:hypothetical protein